jgi:hypothetical protein
MVAKLSLASKGVPKRSLGTRIKDIASFPAGDRQPPTVV